MVPAGTTGESPTLSHDEHQKVIELCINESNSKIPVTNLGDGFRDTTMLSYWGSVIVEANTTGFAMEFIVDLNDSQSLNKHAGSHYNSNLHMGSGVNIQ